MTIKEEIQIEEYKRAFAEAYKQGFTDAMSVYKTEPQTDIVKCTECKYKDQCHKAVQHTTRDWTSITIAYKPIDYCSYGERENK